MADRESMKLNWKAYGVLVAVFALSVGTLLVVPDSSEFIRGAIAAPGVVALVGALFQLMRDEAEYEKRQDAQRREFQFTLGAASHMANAAFDKHADFCEKYMKELHECVRTLYREGDTPQALDHASKLFWIRQDYATWLTDRINAELDEFESALRKLGADAGFIRSTSGHADYAKERSVRIQANHDLFARILGIKQSDAIEENSMVDALKTQVRAIVGIEDLTKLRQHLIRQATAAIGG